MHRLFSLIALLTPAFFPWLALAQGTTGGGVSGGISALPTEQGPLYSSIADIAVKACWVFNVMFTGAVIVTVIFVLLAGLQYITGGGDPGKVKEAHQKLLWAAIGFAVALIAKSVPLFVSSVLGASLAGYPSC